MKPTILAYVDSKLVYSKNEEYRLFNFSVIT